MDIRCAAKPTLYNSIPTLDHACGGILNAARLQTASAIRCNPVSHCAISFRVKVAFKLTRFVYTLNRS